LWDACEVLCCQPRTGAANACGAQGLQAKMSFYCEVYCRKTSNDVLMGFGSAVL
jgi:hypothetical protein